MEPLSPQALGFIQSGVQRLMKQVSMEIGDDDLVTLKEACELFFGGRITPSALRTEARKGNLRITSIASKDFVSRRAIEEMKERCVKPTPAARRASEPTTGITAQQALRLRLENARHRLAKK